MSNCAHPNPWIDPETNLAYCSSCLAPAERVDKNLGETRRAVEGEDLTEEDVASFARAMGLDTTS